MDIWIRPENWRMHLIFATIFMRTFHWFSSLTNFRMNTPPVRSIDKSPHETEYNIRFPEIRLVCTLRWVRWTSRMTVYS